MTLSKDLPTVPTAAPVPTPSVPNSVSAKLDGYVRDPMVTLEKPLR